MIVQHHDDDVFTLLDAEDYRKLTYDDLREAISDAGPLAYAVV